MAGIPTSLYTDCGRLGKMFYPNVVVWTAQIYASDPVNGLYCLDLYP